jgi:hypothetical protein
MISRLPLPRLLAPFALNQIRSNNLLQAAMETITHKQDIAGAKEAAAESFTISVKYNTNTPNCYHASNQAKFKFLRDVNEYETDL